MTVGQQRSIIEEKSWVILQKRTRRMPFCFLSHNLTVECCTMDREELRLSLICGKLGAHTYSFSC